MIVNFYDKSIPAQPHCSGINISCLNCSKEEAQKFFDQFDLMEGFPKSFSLAGLQNPKYDFLNIPPPYFSIDIENNPVYLENERLLTRDHSFFFSSIAHDGTWLLFDMTALWCIALVAQTYANLKKENDVADADIREKIQSVFNSFYPRNCFPFYCSLSPDLCTVKLESPSNQYELVYDLKDKSLRYIPVGLTPYLVNFKDIERTFKLKL